MVISISPLICKVHHQAFIYPFYEKHSSRLKDDLQFESGLSSFLPCSSLTSHGNVNPCPTSVNSTTTTDIKMIALRMGKGVPSCKCVGNPIAMASETIPRMPDQEMIRLFLKSNSVFTLTFGCPRLNARSRLICCR